MREFVKSLAEMESARQDVKLASLVSEKKKVGVFCPVIDEAHFTMCDKLCKMLRDAGIDTVGIAVYEEGLEFFQSLKTDEELLNVAVMAELHRVDTMLILNLHSMWGEMMYQYFARHGIEFYFIENDDAFYYKRNYMYEHISELYDCYVDFVDEYSRKSYLGVIREGMSGQLGEYIMAPEPQYMLDGFAPRLGDVAIDAGAFDGETARDFLWCGAKVYSFEMDEKNYQKCKELGDRIGFEVEAKGLWFRHEFVDYKKNGAASSMLTSGGNCQAEMLDLDSWAVARNIEKVDFIKMDIEGVEFEALQGAKRIISTCKPRLAICAYHKWGHLYALQNYIKSLRPDYEFAFRHYPLTTSILLPYQKEIFAHYGLSESIPTWCECVLYAR